MINGLIFFILNSIPSYFILPYIQEKSEERMRNRPRIVLTYPEVIQAQLGGVSTMT